MNLQFKSDFQALRPLFSKDNLTSFFTIWGLIFYWFDFRPTKSYFIPKKSFRPPLNLKEMWKLINIYNLFILQCVLWRNSYYKIFYWPIHHFWSHSIVIVKIFPQYWTSAFSHVLQSSECQAAVVALICSYTTLCATKTIHWNFLTAWLLTIYTTIWQIFFFSVQLSLSSAPL